MKAFLIAFAIVVLASLAAMVAISFGRGAASGELVHETRDLAGFHRIEIGGQVNVTLIQGAGEGVTIDAPASTRVRTEVRDQTLVVETRGEPHLWRWFAGSRGGRTPRVTINVRDLDRVEAAGAVKLSAEKLTATTLYLDLAGACTLRIRDLRATELKLEGSGATKVDIAGDIVRQEVDLSGAGSYQAAKLASEEATVGVSGAGKAVVNARNALTVDISGAGKVEYVGDPKVKQTISGIGKVTRREAS
jgi:hypothetical protein